MTPSNTSSLLIEPTRNSAVKHCTLLQPTPSYWSLINQGHIYQEEEEEEDESSLEGSEIDNEDGYESDYGESSDLGAVCGCGKILSVGWNCSLCRSNCSSCNRALGPDESCSRCVTMKHNCHSDTRN